MRVTMAMKLSFDVLVATPPPASIFSRINQREATVLTWRKIKLSGFQIEKQRHAPLRGDQMSEL